MSCINTDVFSSNDDQTSTGIPIPLGYHQCGECLLWFATSGGMWVKEQFYCLRHSSSAYPVVSTVEIVSPLYQVIPWNKIRRVQFRDMGNDEGRYRLEAVGEIGLKICGLYYLLEEPSECEPDSREACIYVYDRGYWSLTAKGSDALGNITDEYVSGLGRIGFVGTQFGHPNFAAITEYAVQWVKPTGHARWYESGPQEPPNAVDSVSRLIESFMVNEMIV